MEDVEPGLPLSSFGSLERYVEVFGEAEGFEPESVRIEYSPEHLGWLDPESLRVFRVDPESRTWELVADSGPDGRGVVRARIEHPGIYGVVGLPAHPAVLEAVRRVCALPHKVLHERGRTMVMPICRQILCAPGIDRWTGAPGGPLVPPGGFEGSVCEMCMGLQPPANGLPECQLLERPHPMRESGYRERARAFAVTASAWWALSWGGGPWPSWIYVFDLDPPRLVAAYHLGDRWCTSLAVSSTGDRLYVLDTSVPEIALYDAAGTLLGSAALPVAGSPQINAYDCVLSPDNATLYVSMAAEVAVVDAANLSITATVPRGFSPSAIAVSPDGAIVATFVDPPAQPELSLIDTATLTDRSVSLPPGGGYWLSDVLLMESERALIWHSWGTLHDIDLLTGAATSLQTGFSSAWAGVIGIAQNNSLLYDPRTKMAHAISDRHETPPASSEIASFDVHAGTWSSRQAPGYLTTPALTPGGQILVGDVKVSAGPSMYSDPEYLSIYEPGSGTFHSKVCAVPSPGVRDLKVIAL